MKKNKEKASRTTLSLARVKRASQKTMTIQNSPTKTRVNLTQSTVMKTTTASLGT